MLGGTLGFGVRRAEIPGLQDYLLRLDPYDNTLTEEFWETVSSTITVLPVTVRDFAIAPSHVLFTKCFPLFYH